MTREFRALFGSDTSPSLPWSDEIVETLNDYQKNPLMHPFTCGGDRQDAAHYRDALERGLPPNQGGLLVATNDGWICPICGYQQKWVHRFMTMREQWEPLLKRRDEIWRT